jgi:hypothetical protein
MVRQNQPRSQVSRPRSARADLHQSISRADDGHKSAGMSLVKVSVDSFEVKKEDAHPFCAYELTVTEGGKSHTLSRRWNDLKLMYEELQKEHKAELHAARDRVPKFEPHSWRLGGSHLDPDFLKQRQSRMEELLQALLDAFDISLAAESGPECVRTFLAANGRPSARRTVNALPKELAAELDAVADDDDAAAAAAADDASGEKAPSEDCVPTSASAEGAERDAVTAAEVEEPRGDASWTMIAMWSSVLVMPVLAIVAKELFGGVNYGGAPSVDDFAFPPPSPE